MTDDDDEPSIVTSGKSMRVLIDGMRFQIEICRLETDSTWTLEVVDPENTSHVWEDQFASDRDARDAAITAIESEGALAFMRGDDAIPFRSSDFCARMCRPSFRRSTSHSSLFRAGEGCGLR